MTRLRAWWQAVRAWWPPARATRLDARVDELARDVARLQASVQRLYQMPHNHWVPDRGWAPPPPPESGFTITPHVRIGRGAR